MNRCKFRQISLIAILFVGMTLTTPSKANAYWEVFGYKVPTNFDELMESFAEPMIEAAFVKLETSMVDKDSESLSVESDQGEEVKTDEREHSNNDSTDNDPSTPDFVFNEMLINGAIEGAVVGYNINDRYTVKEAEIDLIDNGAIVKAEFEGGLGLKGEFKLIDGGKDLEVVSLQNIGDNNISRIEMVLIKGALNAAPSIILNYFPEYSDKFDHIEIEDEKVSVWLND